MNRYEVTTILAEETVPNPATGLIEKNNGKILNEEALGKRRFAYPINKLTGGAYHRVRFEAEAPAIALIDAALRHDASVIRHLIVNQPHEPQAPAAAEVDDATIDALGDVKEMTKKAEEETVTAAKIEKAAEPEVLEEAEEIESEPVVEESAEEVEAAAGSEETEEVIDEESRKGALDKKLDEILNK